MSMIAIDSYRFASGLSDYETEATADSPILLWMCDEGTGYDLADDGATGNHPARVRDGVTLAATWGTTSPLGSEVDLDGTNDYIRSNNVINDFNSYQRLTVEFGFRADSFSGTRVLIEHSPNYGSGGGFIIYTDGTYIYVAANRRYSGGSYYREVRYAIPSATTWHFLSATVSVANGTSTVEHTLRIDGVSQTGTITVDSIQTAPSPASDSTPFPTNYQMWLGSRNGASFFFNGQLCGIAVYPNHLSNTRRDAHATAFGV